MSEETSFNPTADLFEEEKNVRHQREIELRRNQVKSLQQQLDAKEKLCDELQSKCRLFSDNEKKTSLLFESKKKSLEQQIQQLKEQLVFLNEEKTALVIDHSQLQQAFRLKEKMLDETEERCRLQMSEMREEEQRSQTNVQQSEQLFDQLRLLNEENDHLCQTFRRSQQTIQRLRHFEELCSKQNDEIERLKRIEEEQINEIDQLRKEWREANLRNASSANFFEKQHAEINERYLHVQSQFNDLQIEHDSLSLIAHNLDLELKQTKRLLDDHRNKETKWKEDLNEIERLNLFSEQIQRDAERFQEDLSSCQTELFQLRIENGTINEDLQEKIHQLEEHQQLQNEQLIQAKDQIQIYKEKLIFLSNCLTDLIRRVSSSVDQFTLLSPPLQSFDADLQSFERISEQFDAMTKNVHQLQVDHHSSLLQISTIRSQVKTFDASFRRHRQLYQSSIERLNRTETELKSVTCQLAEAHAKLGKFDQINQEYHRHITLLERSIEEHKRLIRKRDKEVDDVRKQLDDSKVVYLNSYRKDRRRTKTDCD